MKVAWQVTHHCNDAILQIIGVAVGYSVVSIHPSDVFCNALHRRRLRLKFGDVSGEFSAGIDLCMTEVSA